ncbi:hypothetical protein ACI2K6_08760 [Microbacterium sp. NPDC006705]|jgi:hypothetical protein|uniref:hypothetical protein n=1 Tax=Microbacterium TaxID=33882 RepID=UPI000DCD329F|nr:MULTISPECIES: hypothetical protein [Microbacterium]MDF2920109.1 hypothetical protein [Microbacterium sp.]RAZ32736.1 hypothetical protein DO944_05860 [Microbacterium sp. SMR1]
MRVELRAVAKGRKDLALPPTTLSFRTGRATLAIAETEQRPTVLGLIASGRMRPDGGTVLLDGARASRTLRHKTALIDAPDVSDPPPNISTVGVVSEELMFAGRLADPISARRWLDEHDLRSYSRVPIGDVPATDRIRMLLELAVLRPGVEGIVLVSPDRHGGDPHDWWTLAREFAGRGLAVLVIAGQAAATLLTETDPLAPHRRLVPSGIRLRGTRPKASR